MVAGSASSLLRVMLQSLRAEARPDRGTEARPDRGTELEGLDAWREWWLPDLVNILYSGETLFSITPLHKAKAPYQMLFYMTTS